MSSYNRVIVVGNLVRDPKLRYMPNGDAMVELDLAINSKYDGKESVTWINKITVWKKQAENCAEYLSAGSSVLIEGRLKTEEWGNDGKKFSALRVVGDRVQFLGGKKKDNQQHKNDDIPF